MSLGRQRYPRNLALYLCRSISTDFVNSLFSPRASVTSTVVFTVKLGRASGNLAFGMLGRRHYDTCLTQLDLGFSDAKRIYDW